MLEKCCYEGLISLSTSKMLLCIQENIFLTIDNVVTAEKGWEGEKKKNRDEN